MSDARAIQALEPEALQSRSDQFADLRDPGVSLTVLSQQEDADLNVLMKRFGITGKMPENPRVPFYGDFSEIRDYRSAIEAVRAADIAFMEFPAELRARFDNDPQKLLEFVHQSTAQQRAEVFGERVSSVTGAVGASDIAAGVGSQAVPAAVAGGSGDGGSSGAVGSAGVAAAGLGSVRR